MPLPLLPLLALGGGIASGLSSFFGASAKEKALKALQPVPVTLRSPGDAANEFTSQASSIPNIAAMLGLVNNTDNTAFQQRIAGLDPTILSRIAQAGNNSASMLKGEIPKDVQDRVINSAAYRALQGGFGGSGAARALEARDLGRTSLDLMTAGAGLSRDNATLAASLNPSNIGVGDEILGLKDILKRDDAQDYANNSIINQTNQIKAAGAAQSPVASGIFSGLGSLFGSAVSGGFKGWLPSGASPITLPSPQVGTPYSSYG